MGIISSSEMLRIVASLALIGCALAQDTHYCPDGWTVYESREGVECILLGGLVERVTKWDAELICAGHDGWLVDMDEDSHGHKNHFLKEILESPDSSLMTSGGWEFIAEDVITKTTGETGA